MTPHRARLLLVLTIVFLGGYCFRWFLGAWGWTPIICLAVFGIGGFLSGFLVRCQMLADERDEACRIAVEVREGQRFGVIPIRVDIPRVPRQGAS